MVANRDAESTAWIKELTSSITDKYKEILAKARESMFDIYSIVPHKTFPNTYIGEDILGNEIALIWTEGKELVVRSTSACGKRMN